MRQETRELLEHLVEVASKEEDTVMKKNKVREFLKNWGTEKKGKEIVMSPEVRELIEHMVDKVCEIEYSVTQDNKLKVFIENWIAKNCKEN